MKTTLSKAEEIFSAKGFWTSAVPFMLKWYLTLLAVILVPARNNLTLATASIVIVGTFVLCIGPQLMNYHRGREKHAAFKAKFGTEYVRMIEEGDVQLSPLAVLVARSPGSWEKLIEKRRDSALSSDG